MKEQKIILHPGWEERLFFWIKQYAQATEILVNKHGKSLHEAIEPAFVVFIEEQNTKPEVKS